MGQNGDAGFLSRWSRRKALARQGEPLPEPPRPAPLPGKKPGWMPVAVCGAHMGGLPLNKDMLAHGAKLKLRTKTAPIYRMYHLPGAGTLPPRPGLVRRPENGAAIELEVWDMPESAMGSFFATIKPPLGLSWM